MKIRQTIIAYIFAITAVLITGMANAQEYKSVNSIIPTDDKKLHEWLRAGKYKDFVARESKAHPSAGPHTKYGLPVRVFMEPKVAASMKAGNKQHPAGSAIVKEMFNADNELEGWAVMVKTQAKSEGGKGWKKNGVKSCNQASTVYDVK